MSDYIKKTWVDGEVITAEGLNNLETGIVEAKKEAENVQKDATAAKKAAETKAPAYTYGTEDLTAGSSKLTTGTLHFVYE